MSEPSAPPPLPMFCQPRHQQVHPAWGSTGWGSSWGPYGQGHSMAVHDMGFDPSGTPLVMRMHALQAQATAHIVDGSVVITPPPGAIQLQSSGVSVSSASARLDLIRTVDPAPRIALPPATRLISFLRSILVKSYFDRVIAPYIAQEQHEHYEALLRKDIRQARVVGARMYPMIAWILLRSIVAPVIRLITRGE